MKGNQIIDIDRALAEKRQMQKIFVREKGYPSSVLEIVIKHLEGLKQG